MPTNKTMGNNPNRDRTGTPGTPGERREGMGREQEQRQAGRSDQSGRQNQSGQSDRSNQGGVQDRDKSGRTGH
jgi:hypothetical protein